MSAWELPYSLNVGGVDWAIRTDFRAILDILKYFQDPEYEDDERQMICLDILYKDFGNMSPELWQEALDRAVEFIDMEIREEGKPRPRIMDWEKDGPIIIPAVNSVLKKEVRSPEPLHWWTFLGAYMESRESLFSQVLSVRQKKAEGKKLDKWELEFCRKYKDLVNLGDRKTKRSKEEQDELDRLFGRAKR